MFAFRMVTNTFGVYSNFEKLTIQLKGIHTVRVLGRCINRHGKSVCIIILVFIKTSVGICVSNGWRLNKSVDCQVRVARLVGGAHAARGGWSLRRGRRRRRRSGCRRRWGGWARRRGGWRRRRGGWRRRRWRGAPLLVVRARVRGALGAAEARAHALGRAPVPLPALPARLRRLLQPQQAQEGNRPPWRTVF